jgi:hypothetical protein
VYPRYAIGRLSEPETAETLPFGLNSSVVGCETSIGDPEMGIALPTDENVVAGGTMLDT